MYQGSIVTNVKEDKMKNKQIIIPLTQDNIEALREGETFDWTFPVEGNSKEWIDVKLIGEEL